MKRIFSNPVKQTVALLGVVGVAVVPALLVMPPAVQADPAQAVIRVYDNDAVHYDGDDKRAVFVGRVDKIKGHNEFNLKAEGYLFNVFTIHELPTELSRRDHVRVGGDRTGHNDIRNAHVEIIRDH